MKSELSVFVSPLLEFLAERRNITEIVLPCTEIIVTLIVGIIVASSLKKREERSKIKSTLIDDYIAFLKVILDLYKEFLRSNESNIYKKLAECYVINEDNKSSLTKLSEALNNNVPKESPIENWFYYTHRFTLLLGIKNYHKHLQNLEDKVMDELLNSDAVQNYELVLFKALEENTELIGFLKIDKPGTSNQFERIHYFLNAHSVNHAQKFLDSYADKVSKLINKI